MVVEDISQLILIYIFPSVKKNTKDRITVTQNKQNFLKHLKVPYNICLELSKVIIARIIATSGGKIDQKPKFSIPILS